MDQINILIIIGVVLLGLVAYSQYQIDRLKKEIGALWLQLWILSGATAEKLEKLEKKKDE